MRPRWVRSPRGAPRRARGLRRVLLPDLRSPGRSPGHGGAVSRPSLPCPFCGSTRLENFDGNYLRCIDCGACGPPNALPVNTWNRRVPERPLRAAARSVILAPNHVQLTKAIRELETALWARPDDAPEPPPPDPQPPPHDPQPPAPPSSDSRSVTEEIRAEVEAAALSAKYHEALRTMPPARSGTRVQCGPLTLNIPPGYLCDVAQGKLYVRSPDGKAVCSVVHVAGAQGDDPEFVISV